ncbi:hypothetical protein [Lysobacter enzymogenes]|uniref:hypothetical protein n=1 Tax=Lysobacter enzymogenes TaxID=69 RepID=UPI002264DF81|nr:hypothetical protein [Lysobacter enzymogenes]UZW62373.1 hypothetical protein BV903_008825 [Lysobacter enzymogenes]
MLLTRHSTAKAAALRISLEVGETWDASDTERAFNFKKRWVDLITKAPRGTHEHYEMLGAQIAAKKLQRKGGLRARATGKTKPLFREAFLSAPM